MLFLSEALVSTNAESLEPTIEAQDEAGNLTVKELSREVLSKGAWSTIMYLYQELDAKSGEFTEPKVTIRRYQKVAGVWKQRSKFNITSQIQAHKMVEILQNWYPSHA